MRPLRPLQPLQWCQAAMKFKRTKKLAPAFVVLQAEQLRLELRLRGLATAGSHLQLAARVRACAHTVPLCLCPCTAPHLMLPRLDAQRAAAQETHGGGSEGRRPVCPRPGVTSRQKLH